MFSTDDSIVAVATPPGRGGIGVVRISGPASLDIAADILERGRLRARRATYTRVRGGRTADDSRPRAIDEVIATYFPAPHSYTGEHVVEISAHGAPVILQAIVRRAVEAGARLAAPGEFTLRSFLNGKRDLVQAEAVADLVAAATPLQARQAFDQLEGTLTRRIAELDQALFDLVARLEASLDFPDEGYHFIDAQETTGRLDALVGAVDRLLDDGRSGRLIREGATVVVAGRPNVGKSSLFNALVGTDRAIVAETAGTTRDLVSEPVDLDGLAVTLVDTAGWRETADAVEREGVDRAARALAVADVLLLVVDRSRPLTAEDERLLHETPAKARLVVLNKADLPEMSDVPIRPGHTPVVVSALTGAGLPTLRQAIVERLTGRDSLRDAPAVSNERHIGLLRAARAALLSARGAAASGASEEFVLADLQAARSRLEEVVGARTSEDVLHHIFDRFCIGK